MICVLALRSNNQNMIKLRDVVFAADKSGSDVQKPLQDLQAYVTTHMNTDLSAGKNAVYPPIQLQYTHERLVEQLSQKIAATNSQLYNDAQHYCEQQNPTGFSGRTRVDCVMQYVDSHGTEKIPTVPTDLYKFSFASPRWSPDLAGWSLVLTVVSGFLFVVSLVGQWWLKRVVK